MSETMTETITATVATTTTVVAEAPVLPFEPAIHLAFEPPAARHSFTELGLDRPTTAPDVCYTDPFPLFSAEGVRMIRQELLSKKVLDKHLTSWPRAPCIISYHEETATWINNMWNHPAVRECIETAFGEKLKILGRRGEVGHCNVQLGFGGKEAVYDLKAEPSPPKTESEKDDDGPYSKTLTDAWHRDSTQLVVVVMLSDTSTMDGGETAIRVGGGKVLKARGASAGTAVLLQGAHTPHAALRATNIHERISMVTSWHFANPDLDDTGTSLRSVKPDNPLGAVITDDFFSHKLKKLRDRIDVQLERLEERRVRPTEDPHRPLLGREAIEGWAREQVSLLTHTAWELCERYPKWLYQDVPATVMGDYAKHTLVADASTASTQKDAHTATSNPSQPSVAVGLGFLAGLTAGVVLARRF
ncbi:hypothetical protein Sste5346_008313 [Sporothrix stenoceras]|uniref:Fe2OG dioxygenase domain-containing protein n=1 Tax=Sporothrix stenoceras TaxID=5173 RepID=A0ABR3YPS4_9PEZI